MHNISTYNWFFAGFGGGFDERGTVEYNHYESDDEFDDFGRKKKKRGNAQLMPSTNPIKSMAPPVLREEEEEEDEEEDDDDDGDLSKENINNFFFLFYYSTSYS